MIVFTDVDGTLYDYQGVLPESAKTAVKKLKDNGHKVYMVTGRSKAENKEELWQMGFDGIICGNGSYIESDGEVIYHKCLRLEECKQIVDWCDERKIGFYEESNSGLYASKYFYSVAGKAIAQYKYGKDKNIEGKTENVDDAIHGLIRDGQLYREDVNKISFVLNSQDDYLEAVKRFPDLKVGTWGGKKEDAIFGDIGIQGADKAKAIAFLLDYLKQDVQNTLAIGDAESDIPMLEYCHIGVAVNSGGEGIKAMADYITDDVDKDGFYKAMEHFNLI